MKTLLLPCLLIPLLFSACVPFNYNATTRMYRDKQDIQDGVLIAGQEMKRFRKAWGNPTKTFSRRFVTDYRPSSCSAEKSVIGWPVDSATKENQAATWREDWRAFCQLCGVSWATCWFVVVGRRSKTSLR